MEKAERLARELLGKTERGELSEKDLAAMGLSSAGLRAFLGRVERARAASARANDSASPPTFADFLREADRAVRAGRGSEGGPGSSRGEGRGTLSGVFDAVKETIDLEYRDILEEYYRSLADPARRARPR